MLRQLIWSLSLPFPPSGNHRNGRSGKRTYRPKSTQDYFTEVWATVRQQNGPHRLEGGLIVEIDCHAPDRRCRDLDNIAKVLLDALTEAGVWEDDSQVQVLTLRKAPSEKPGRVQVRIEEKSPVSESKGSS